MFSFTAAKPFGMESGVGIGFTFGANVARGLFEYLLSKWAMFTSDRDLEFLWLNYAIVKPSDNGMIDRCLEELGSGFKSVEDIVEGLNPWRDDGQHWMFERTWNFQRVGG
jgi:hypothetical protein